MYLRGNVYGIDSDRSSTKLTSPYPLSTDPTDLNPLTPAHFLIERSLMGPPVENVLAINDNRLSRFQMVQKLAQHFWTRWSKEFIGVLQSRVKWRTRAADRMQSGALVILRENNLPPLQWRLGRIVAVHPGRDNVVRVVTVSCANEALPLVTVVVGSKISGDKSVVITTKDDVGLPKKVVIEMPDKRALICHCKREKPQWANYVRGVIVKYIGHAPTFQAVIASSVPTGSGLSSSAALEVGTYTFLDTLNGPNNVSLVEKALACQKAECDYVGMPCGIMDQFISFMGKEGNALVIDCRTMVATLVPLADPNVVILITNSNVKHKLIGSEYSTRREQCQQASLLIKKVNLRDANDDDIKYLQSINADKELIMRARHVISENERTLAGVEALKEQNYQKFGQLMIQSHRSLKDDFQVSCPEVDSLVELALEVDGVLGSRMTGAGFGGSTVTMVYSYAVQNTIEHIKKNYKGRATFYICKSSDGAKVLKK